MPGHSQSERAEGAVVTPANTTSSGRFRLSLLGPFLLVDAGGREIAVASQKNRLLLAMLATAPAKSISREVLAGALWGDHSEDQAKNSLRQALAVLRKELSGREDDLFSSLDATVSLNPSCVEFDTDEFRRAADSPDA